MSKYLYELSNGTLCVKNCKEPLEIFDLRQEMPEFTEYYRALLAHKRDMDYAKEYLQQMFFHKDTTLIDGALINCAIQLLVRCFSNPSCKGRARLDSKKVFCKYAKKLGMDDMTKQFGQFYFARNHVIAHDQNDHNENIIGIVISKESGECIDVASLTMRTTYLYQQNKDILMKLISIVDSYIEQQLAEVESKIIDAYNSLVIKPNLSKIETNIPPATSW